MSISVVTASYNSLSTIVTLAESLKKQSSHEFEWIVVDGASTDGTIEFFREFSSENVWCQFISQPDFGVYDALNKAIKQTRFTHYLTVGADDYLHSDAIETLNSALMEYVPDILLMKVNKGGKVCGGFSPQYSWLGHSFVFHGSHSVGMLINKSLHDSYGYYSNRFPVLADGFFLKKVLNSGCAKFISIDYISGFFSIEGMSNFEKMQTLVESWQIQMLTERHKFLQVVIFVGKLFFRLPYLLR